MKKKTIALSLLLLLFTALLPLSAVTIKMGSLFPEGTEWDRSLRKIAGEWKEITGGRVTLKIYPGGIAGSEEDMVRKMRIGQLDAGVFTSIGMNKIVTDSLVLSLPFLVQTEEELDFALEELTPLFDEAFNEKGFQVLLWSKSGWINFFSDREIYTPDDLRKTKMAVDPGAQDMIEAFKALDFNVIPLAMNDTLMGLQSGMINTFYSAPMGAAAFQWFALASNMNPLNVMPLIGGVVLSDRAWKKIPSQYHEELRESMQKVQQEFSREAEKLNQTAMEVMRENGIVELNLSESDKQAWYDLFKDGYWMIVGDDRPISRESYEQVKSRLDKFRAGR